MLIYYVQYSGSKTIETYNRNKKHSPIASASKVTLTRFCVVLFLGNFYSIVQLVLVSYFASTVAKGMDTDTTTYHAFTPTVT